MEPVTDARGLPLEKGDSIIVVPDTMPKSCKEGIFSHYDAILDRVFFVNMQTGNSNRCYKSKVYKVPPKD